MEPISRKRKNKRQKSEDSLKKNMPTITVPAAPIPVQTAYPVPIGIVCMALFSRKKLIEMQIKKPTLHFQLLKLSESFRQVVKPTSNSPAIMRISQAILIIRKRETYNICSHTQRRLTFFFRIVVHIRIFPTV